jgi:hypothetical protein
MGDQRRTRAHARSGSRGFTAGVTASDDNDIEARIHRKFSETFLLANARWAVKNQNVSRETPLSIGRRYLQRSLSNAKIAEDDV